MTYKNIKINGVELSANEKTYPIYGEPISRKEKIKDDLRIVSIVHAYQLQGLELYSGLPQQAIVNGYKCYKTPIDEYGNFKYIEIQ